MVGRGLVWENGQWREVFTVNTDPFIVMVDGEVLAGEELDRWIADQHKPLFKGERVHVNDDPKQWLEAEAALVRTYFRVVIDS